MTNQYIAIVPFIQNVWDIAAVKGSDCVSFLSLVNLSPMLESTKTSYEEIRFRRLRQVSEILKAVRSQILDPIPK